MSEIRYFIFRFCSLMFSLVTRDICRLLVWNLCECEKKTNSEMLLIWAASDGTKAGRQAPCV